MVDELLSNSKKVYIWVTINNRVKPKMATICFRVKQQLVVVVLFIHFCIAVITVVNYATVSKTKSSKVGACAWLYSASIFTYITYSEHSVFPRKNKFVFRYLIQIQLLYAGYMLYNQEWMCYLDLIYLVSSFLSGAIYFLCYFGTRLLISIKY